MREIPFSLVQFPLYEYMKVKIILLTAADGYGDLLAFVALIGYLSYK